MQPCKCIVTLLSLSLALAIPKGIVDEQKAALEFQTDPSGLKGRKSEAPQVVERSLYAGQPSPVSAGLKSPSKAIPIRSNQESSITLAPKIVSTSIRIDKEPTASIPVPGQCDPTRPHSPHPTNCYMFYHCVQRLNYVEKVEKTCNPPTMFNPDNMICDWPESVRKIRPECGVSISGTQSPIVSPINSSSAGLKTQPNPIKSASLITKTATCVPPCQNLGFCKAPGECICPETFEGPQCQFVKTQRCLQKPPTPSNSRVLYNDKEYVSTCFKGFAFPDGSKELKMVCDSGNWVQHHQPTGTIQKVPDCQPVCDQPCFNGGRCLPNNLCDCPQEFRGPQCNYPVKNCAPELMNFNGGYNCTIGSSFLRCSLKCGVNGVFEYPPAAVYSCEYAKAKFTPEPIPQCIFARQQSQNLKSKPTNQSQVLIEQSAGLKGNFQHSANHETEWYHPTTASPKIVSTSIHSEEKSQNPGRVPDRCDPARPHSPHPTNCYLFYHCVNGIRGVVYLEKTCQPPAMFNPNTMICDWPESVMRIRPCGVITAPSTNKETTADSCVDGWGDWVSVSTPAENAGDFELYEQMVPQDPVCPSSSVREIEHQVRFRCHCEDDTSLPLVKISEPLTAEKFTNVATTRKPTATEKVVLAPTTPAIAKKNLECPKGYSWSRCAYICTRLCSSYAVEVKKQGRCQTSNDLSCTPGCVEDDGTMDQSCLWFDKYTCVPPTDCVAAPTQQIHQKG